MATRRQIVGGLLAAAGVSSGVVRAAEAPVTLLAAAKIKGGYLGARWRDGDATPLTLPGRGHAIIRAPQGRALFVSRRPGLYAAVVDPRDPSVPAQVMPPAEACVFSGHAAISPAGRLVTSEFRTDSLQARAVPRDLATGKPMGAWDLPGIEPHDMVFARGGETLVVAIGGLVKDGGVAGPAFNPDGVDSSVVEVDPSSGRVVKRHKLGAEHASLSLRHLALSPDGRRVAVAMQDQDLAERRPLVGLIEVGRGLNLLQMPDPQVCDFRGYLGSIGFDPSGRFIAATSPRGGAVGLWSSADGRWLGGVRISDVCGLAQGRGPGELWASSGLGEIVALNASDGGLQIVRRWSGDLGYDNHLLMV
jgi:hypothetical protein